MLYREIIASQHINTLCGKNVEFKNVNRVEYKVTSGLEIGYGVMSFEW
jgi:hypothetical protein